MNNQPVSNVFYKPALNQLLLLSMAALKQAIIRMMQYFQLCFNEL